MALDDAADDELSPDVVRLIIEQKAKLKRAHDEIKMLRDSQVA